jgi:hypothetical protein
LSFVQIKHIFECLRSGDLKRTSNLIKEYFPSHILNSPPSDKVNK